MQISYMTDNDWDLFVEFTKKNIHGSFVSNRTFNEYWFRKKSGKWTIQIAKNKEGKISAVNMLIETKGKICGSLHPFTWASTAYADYNARNRGVVGLMLFNLYRKLPLIGSTCANKNSLPINKELGLEIPNLKMRRFIYVHNLNCLQIVKKKSQLEIKKNIRFVKFDEDNNIEKSWSRTIPKDINDLWEMFSHKFNCCIEKNLNFLNWRYIKSPFQNYDILIFRDKKRKLLGISIIRFQETKYGVCARIVDFMSLPNYEYKVWNQTLRECELKNSLYTDFLVVGNNQDKNLLNAGFQLASKINKFEEIPNLLSPIDYRQWSYTFHLGGFLPRKIKGWENKNKVWFTKGDGDRDWPTPNDIKG